MEGKRRCLTIVFKRELTFKAILQNKTKQNKKPWLRNEKLYSYCIFYYSCIAIFISEKQFLSE